MSCIAGHTYFPTKACVCVCVFSFSFWWCCCCDLLEWKQTHFHMFYKNFMFCSEHKEKSIHVYTSACYILYHLQIHTHSERHIFYIVKSRYTYTFWKEGLLHCKNPVNSISRTVNGRPRQCHDVYDWNRKIVCYINGKLELSFRLFFFSFLFQFLFLFWQLSDQTNRKLGQATFDDNRNMPQNN